MVVLFRINKHFGDVCNTAVNAKHYFLRRGASVEYGLFTEIALHMSGLMELERGKPGSS